MGPIANFVSSLPSLFISIVTVLVTVGFAFWLREKQDKIDTLRAVVTEIEQNDIHAEMVIHDLFQSRDGFRHPGDDRTVPSFQTTAYEHLKDSGQLSQLSENVKMSIHYHYTVVESLNRRLEQRQDAQLITSSTNQKNTQISIDRSIFDLLTHISSPERLQVAAENLQDNKEFEYRLRGRYRMNEDQTEFEEGERRQTFDGIKEFLITVIEQSNTYEYF